MRVQTIRNLQLSPDMENYSLSNRNPPISRPQIIEMTLLQNKINRRDVPGDHMVTVTDEDRMKHRY